MYCNEFKLISFGFILYNNCFSLSFFSYIIFMFIIFFFCNVLNFITERLAVITWPPPQTYSYRNCRSWTHQHNCALFAVNNSPVKHIRTELEFLVLPRRSLLHTYVCMYELKKTILSLNVCMKPLRCWRNRQRSYAVLDIRILLIKTFIKLT